MRLIGKVVLQVLVKIIFLFNRIIKERGSLVKFRVDVTYRVKGDELTMSR